MRAEELIQFMHAAEGLKCRVRHSVTSSGREESVAEHCWRLALLAMLLREEFPGLDLGRVVEMCLVHDLGEAVTGDIPAFLKTGEHVERENRALEELIGMLPKAEREHLAGLIGEMEASATDEAKLFQALDRCEALLQHNEAPLSSWIELEYGLQLTYGQEQCGEFRFTRELREALRLESEQKIREQEPRRS